MSRLVARILLCLLVIPLAVAFFFLLAITLDSAGFRGGEPGLITVGMLTWLFVCIYWTMIWRKAVRWTARRRVGPYLAAIVCALIGALLVVPHNHFERQPLWIMVLLIMSLAWLITSIILWQETPLERAQRLQMSNQFAIACPTCGYNLTGLSEARCPECGAKYTLDELFASQPKETPSGIE